VLRRRARRRGAGLLHTERAPGGAERPVMSPRDLASWPDCANARRAAQGIPGWNDRLKDLQQRLSDALLRASPDFQDKCEPSSPVTDAAAGRSLAERGGTRWSSPMTPISMQRKCRKSVRCCGFNCTLPVRSAWLGGYDVIPAGTACPRKSYTRADSPKPVVVRDAVFLSLTNSHSGMHCHVLCELARMHMCQNIGARR